MTIESTTDLLEPAMEMTTHRPGSGAPRSEWVPPQEPPSMPVPEEIPGESPDEGPGEPTEVPTRPDEVEPTAPPEN